VLQLVKNYCADEEDGDIYMYGIGTRAMSRFLCLITIFAVLTLSVGCSSLPASAPSPASDQAQAAQDDTAKFEALEHDLFAYIAEDNTLNMNFYVAHPENYDLTPPATPTLGEFSAQSIEKEYEMLEQQRSLLDAVNREALSSADQITYDLLKTFYDEQSAGKEFLYFYELLYPSQGQQTELPIILAEYHLREKKDVEDYIALVKDIPRYFDQIMAFEQEKSEKGLFMSDRTLDHAISDCTEFIEKPENNVLISAFDSNIDSVDFLSETEKADYKKTNKENVLNEVIPAYEKLIKDMNALRGTGIKVGGLAKYPGGKEYYAQLLKETVGFSLTPEEAFELLNEKFEAYQEEMEPVLYDEDAFEKVQSAEYPETEPAAILKYLQKAIDSDYPELGEVYYTLKNVDKSLKESSSPAYYISPAIDEMKDNFIYVNKAQIAEDASDIFNILAHEGFPGHLYQTNYFMKTKHNPLRDVLQYTGYKEGWATYVELDAYRMAGFKGDVAGFMAADTASILCLYEIMDIGINYYGWSLKKAAKEIEETYGIDAEFADVVYDAVADAPAMYAAYTLGYLEFDAMREKAETALGDQFDAKEFHKFLMETGDAHFDVLNQYEDLWIAGVSGTETEN
jgi:uncharacterized protein (DUF885 family)